MVPRADADAFAVEDRREVMRVDVADGQRDDARAVLDARTVDRDVRDLAQTCERVRRELEFVAVDAGNSLFVWALKK